MLASSEKFGSALPFRVVDFDDVTAAITDESDTETLESLQQAGLKIINTVVESK